MDFYLKHKTIPENIPVDCLMETQPNHPLCSKEIECPSCQGKLYQNEEKKVTVYGVGFVWNGEIKVLCYINTQSGRIRV